MENFMVIKAESRQEVGKKVAKKIRKTGKIPAIIYGGDRETIPITILLDDLKSILKSEKKENTLLRIERDNMKVDAMLKEIQFDYLSDNIIHADFIRIDLNKPVTILVPVMIQGEPVGVRIEDGIFDFVNREIKISCLAKDVPKEIVVDVTELHSGNSIKVGSIELDDRFTVLSDHNRVICAVTTKGAIEEVVEEEVEEAEEAEQSEEETKSESPVEGEDKKADGKEEK